jgi:hypothetical protein
MRKVRPSAQTSNIHEAENNTELGARNIHMCLAPPPPRPLRWSPQKKAAILAAVRSGSISLNQACNVYELSVEEFLTWQRGDALYGLAGLRATKRQWKNYGSPAHRYSEERPPFVSASASIEDK